MKLTRALRSPLRVLRHVFVDGNYQPYYSAAGWERTWRDEKPDFTGPNEDVHFGAMLQILRRYDRGPLLDLGCGDGLLWQYYRPLSLSPLTGIDYSSTAIDRARARALPDCEFDCADFQTYLPRRRFSAVIFNESVYYVENIDNAVQRAESWLDENGVLIFCMIDTLVTQRVWKGVRKGRPTLQGARVRDLGTGRSRTVRVLAPRPH